MAGCNDISYSVWSPYPLTLIAFLSNGGLYAVSFWTWVDFYTCFNQNTWQKGHIWLQILEYKNTSHSPPVLEPFQIIFLCRNRALLLFECSFCYWRLEPSSLGIGRTCSPASWDLQKGAPKANAPSSREGAETWVYFYFFHFGCTLGDR